MFWFTIALNIILTPCKVPHKVTPIHKVTLVRKEELYVLQLGWNLHAINLMTGNATHPLFVLTRRTWVIHTWEEHILFEHLCRLMTNNVVRIFLILRSFFLTFIYRCTLVKLVVHAIFGNSRLT